MRPVTDPSDNVTTASRLDELVAQVSALVEEGTEVDLEVLTVDCPELREQLEMLLPTLRTLAEFEKQDEPADLKGTLAWGNGPVDAESRQPAPGLLGDFRILGEIGRGGMGVVYEAEQISLGRKVALKVLPFAAMLDKQQLARFKNEARAAATLSHPHIVAVYSVGVERGVHYYAMQLIEGRSLAQVLDQMRSEGDQANELVGTQIKAETAAIAGAPTLEATRSSLPEFGSRTYFRAVADLGAQAADALNHAHENGILHRDIKPANLLIDDDGKLWIADFGLARVGQDAGMTMTGDIIGTLRYMSPEQSLAKRVVVDQRSDIYSLGMTLYELLTLKPAFEGNDRQELLRQIAFEEPRRLHHWRPGIPRDLETIVLKMIEKNPSDRYTTADEVAEELRRFLADRPIKAKPAGVVQRVSKWTRRHVAAVWTALGVLLLATLLMGVSTLLIAASRNEVNTHRLIATQERDKAVSERETAVAERNNARLQQYYAEIISGHTDLVQGNLGGLYQKLIHHLPLGENPDRRGWEWYFLFSHCHPEERAFYYPGAGIYAAWSPDGRYIGTTGAIWDVRSGECIQLIEPSLVWTVQCAWSPDSQQLAMGAVFPDNNIYIWHLKERRLRVFRGHDTSIWGLNFSPDGKRLASGGIEGIVCIWNTATGDLLHTISFDSGNPTSVEWSPDGQLLAVGVGSAQGLRIYDASNWQLVQHLPEVAGAAVNVSWRPDGRQLAVNSSHRRFILNRDDWSVLVEHAHPWGDEDLEGMDIAWNPAGTCVAYSLRTAVEIWDPEQDAIVRRLIGNVDQVKSLSWDPDGSHLLTSDTSHRIKIWNVATPNSSPTIETEGPLQSLTWGDSESLALDAVTADDLSNSRWNVTESLRVSGPTSVVSRQGKRVLSPDRRWVANWANPTDESSVVVYDARNGDIAAVLTPQPPFKPLGTGDAVSWSPDGAKLSVAICTETESGLEVWDVRSEKRVARWTRIPARSATWADVNFRRLTWSPDGKWVAAIGRGEDADSGTYKWSGRVHVVDAQTGIRVAKLAAGTEGRDNLSTFAWSPDSRSVAMATPEGAITITEVGTGRQVGRCKPHDLSISALVWSPDGQRLASSSIDGSISIVAPQGGRELLQLTPRSGAANLLAWSPDGHALAAASENAIEVWDATSGYAFAPGNAREPELAWVYSELASESSVEMQTALEQLIKLAPRRLDYCVLRSDSCAQLLRYEQAAKELNSVVTPNLEETWQLAYFQLFAYLGSGELEAYDELLGQMDKEIWKSADEIPWTDRDIYFRLRSLWLNSFVPQTSGDFKLRLDQFNRYLQGADPGQQEIGKRYLGPLLYRLGRYEEAAEMLKSMALELADALTADDKHRFAVQRIFWAMARHRLGHHYQAKRLLAESLPACYMLERDPLEHWTRAVALKTLRMEAESLLGVQEATSETSDLNE